MRLFSGDPLVFIGPGSEWFWAALSGIVTMITLVAIWRQLRLQASQAAIDQVDATMREFFSERMLGHQLEILLALQAGVDPAHVPPGSGAQIYNFFSKLGMLVKSGHVQLETVAGMASIAQAWWATLEPHVRATQATTRTPAGGDPFEWLVGRLARETRASGAGIVFDDDYVRDSLERRIALTRDMLRVEQSLRTVIVSPPAETGAAGAAPAGTGSAVSTAQSVAVDPSNTGTAQTSTQP
jgi:hypothetical protein